MRVSFDVASPYYLPQYEPVARELSQRGAQLRFVVHDDQDRGLIGAVTSRLDALGCDHLVVPSHQIVAAHRDFRSDWAIYGNRCTHLAELPSGTRSALLYHGIGVKACYYDADLSKFTVRFTEGRFRTAELKRRYPHGHFVDTGFAKLDPLLSGHGLGSDAIDLPALGLRADRPTVLYAPTYYPSSIECLPIDWPRWLPDVNIIIKPHMLTWASDRYLKQQHLLNQWDREPNVHVARVSALSLLPFMDVADLLVSEASSALFEFGALGRPVVWCDFYKLRWSYRGPLRFRHTSRMDQTIQAFRHVGEHARRAADLPDVIRDELLDPGRHAAGRVDCTKHLIGCVDGFASARVVNELLG